MAKETAEYSLGGESRGLTIEMGGPEGDTARHAAKERVEFDTDDLDADRVGAGEDDAGADDTDATALDGDGADSPDAEAAEAEHLPDFDPEDPEVVEAYDAKFTTEDGSLDADGALSAEYFANLEQGIDGLNEATYEYLASKGISKATVKQIEAMAATNRDAEKAKAAGSVEAQDAKLFEIAGGPDELAKALAWGKEGGYTADQQKRFNKITSGKDLEAKQEVVEALMSRYRRANPTQKPGLPRRDATKSQGKTRGDGAKPFTTRSEMREFRSQLRDNDTKGWAAFNARLKASNFKD